MKRKYIEKEKTTTKIGKNIQKGSEDQKWKKIPLNLE